MESHFNNHLIEFSQKLSSSNPSLGKLTFIQNPDDLPFEIKRAYWIYDVNSSDVTRGFHSHKKLHQVLVCMHGSVDINIQNFKENVTYTLNDPSVGLYIGPDNWREMSNFSDGAVLTVFASEKYDENDYIRDYDTFVEYTKKKYGGKCKW